MMMMMVYSRTKKKKNDGISNAHVINVDIQVVLHQTISFVRF